MFLFSFIGPIPIDLTRLVGLRVLNIGSEELLDGFFTNKTWLNFHFGFEYLGEFPLVEGSFQNLSEVDLSHGISSFENEIFQGFK